jgi:hypothetical protein
MAKTRSKVEELNRSAERARDTQQRHIAALQAKNEQVWALLPVAARERRTKWGPSVDDLHRVIDAALEASDPQRSAPIGDTMRVSVPSSEGDEGAATRRMREKANQMRRDVGQLAARYATVFGVDLPDRRDWSAHVKWHEMRGRTESGCEYCEEREAS